MKRLRLTIMAVAAAGLMASGSISAEARNLRAYCDDQARSAADHNDHPVANLLGGAAIGAATGAIIGGAIGHGNGAAQGAIIGSIGGGALGAGTTGARWRRTYDEAFAQCMDENTPARAVYRAAPPPGTEEWYDYCAAKYPSFNPDTGMYRTGNGWRKCR